MCLKKFSLFFSDCMTLLNQKGEVKVLEYELTISSQEYAWQPFVPTQPCLPLPALSDSVSNRNV